MNRLFSSSDIENHSVNIEDMYENINLTILNNEECINFEKNPLKNKCNVQFQMTLLYRQN